MNAPRSEQSDLEESQRRYAEKNRFGFEEDLEKTTAKNNRIREDSEKTFKELPTE